jgi:hypothetical protein
MVRGFTPSLVAYPRGGYASDFGKDDAMTGRIRAVTNFRALCCGLEEDDGDGILAKIYRNVLALSQPQRQQCDFIQGPCVIMTSACAAS